jgi:hypothetical protein
VQVGIMGRVGGDNDSYIERGLYALDDPDFLIVNEPFTVLFAHGSQLLNVPLPNFYAILTTTLMLYALASSRDRFIYLIAYTLFVIPIAIGYLRQGLAMSLLLLMMMSASRVSMVTSSIISVVAHPASLLPLAVAQAHRQLKNSTALTKIILLLGGIGLYNYVSDSLGHYLTHYSLESDVQSSGYWFRLATYIFILTIISINRDEKNKPNTLLRGAWTISLISVVMFFLSGSTAADRIQIFVVPWILCCIARSRVSSSSIYISIVSVGYLISWLLLSPHAQANWQYNSFILSN